MKDTMPARLMQERLRAFIAESEAELADNKAFIGQVKQFLDAFKPSKPVKKASKPRTPKALPYDGVIGKVNGADTQISSD